MNGKRIIVVTLALSFATCGGPLLAQENLQSLRGTTPIESTSATPEQKHWQGKTDLIIREFIDQPPLIPHKSQSQKINLLTNKCLTCHGADTYQKKKATKVSDTHFKDRDGKQLNGVSASRYFCTQCHVEQRDAAPLVANAFKPDPACGQSKPGC